MSMTYHFGSFWWLSDICYISIFSYFCSRNNEGKYIMKLKIA